MSQSQAITFINIHLGPLLYNIYLSLVSDFYFPRHKMQRHIIIWYQNIQVHIELLLLNIYNSNDFKSGGGGQTHLMDYSLHWIYIYNL